eukprot:TRINITY_DN2620_c0_g2_i1.p1 TRINITY_DN2620_c0_g2~~TRINITY_DN2620_c0_g2_i1.p1  ORF type:complete len:687 (-),score=249.70 TRINITY_DN2620_c0_g2_i1:67-1989(-)
MSTDKKNFFQRPPQLHNWYETDRTLKQILRKYIVDDGQYAMVDGDLKRFCQRVIEQVVPDAELCDTFEPRLIQIDAFARRIDEIQVHEAWKRLHAVAAEEGLIAIGYERPIGELSRLYQFSKLYMFSPVTIVACPLAMTDGAARLVEVKGDAFLMKRAFERLVSRDPKVFVTSGQWMTEKTGGSDVAQTSTTAAPLDRSSLYPGHYFPTNSDKDSKETSFQISGYKFFTSATTSEIAFTLARVQKPDGSTIPGSPGLTCFYVDVQADALVQKSLTAASDPVFHQDPSDRSFMTAAANRRHPAIQVTKLKHKLGTRALPTSELQLTDLPGYRVGDFGRGIPTIALMFNITRLHNAISSVAYVKLAMVLATDFAKNRTAFGAPLHNQPLHIITLARVQAELDGCLHLIYYALFLQGKEETGGLTETEGKVLRLLIPLIKLYTAKLCVKSTSELLECFGGMGYMEDSGIPRILRDSQVLPIWEGTTNILSLDVLRALKKSPDSLQAFMANALSKIRSAQSTFSSPSSAQSSLSPLASQLVQQALDSAKAISGMISSLSGVTKAQTESIARDLSFALASFMTSSLLIEHLAWSFVHLADDNDVSANATSAKLFMDIHLQPSLFSKVPFSEAEIETTHRLVFGRL